MTAQHTTAASSTSDAAASAEQPLLKARGVIHDQKLRVLAVLPAPERRPKGGKACWYLPGGTVHDGESPHAGANREIREELGLTQLRAGQLPLTVWSWPRLPLVRPRLHLLFDFGRHHQRELSDRIVLRAEEISDYAWLDSDGVDSHLFPAQARQLHAIARHRTYLEQGLTPHDQIRLRPEHALTVATPVQAVRAAPPRDGR